MFRIIEPCGKSWGELAGEDGRRRYCGDCGKFVHAVEGYSEAERRELLSRMDGFCVSLHAVPRAAPRRAVLLAGLLGAMRPLWAETGELRVKVLDLTGAGITGARVKVLAARDAGAKGGGAAARQRADLLPPVLLGEVQADAAGLAVVRNLPVGVPVDLEIESPGFVLGRQTVMLEGAVTSITLELQVGSVGGGDGVPGCSRWKSFWRRVVGR